MPEGFGVVVLRAGESGARSSLTLGQDGDTVWSQKPGEEPEQLGVLDADQRAALWRTLHERGFARLSSPARGLPGETIIQVMPGGQAAHVKGPPGFDELVAAVEAALREAGPPVPPMPRSLAVFVGDPLPAAPSGDEDGRVALHEFALQGTWLEADGTVAREDREGLRLVGVLPEAGRAAVWALLHRAGYERLAPGDPSGPVALSVWVDGRERRVTREPGAATPELQELQQALRARLGAGLAPLPEMQVPPRPDDFSFTLGHGGGAAAQWDEVVVAPDGAVERRTRRGDPTPAGKLEPAVLDAVWRELHVLRYFELGSVPGNMTDAISVRASGREHRAAYAMDQGPVRFRILLAFLRARAR